MRSIATGLRSSLLVSFLFFAAAAAFAEPGPKLGPLASERAAHAGWSRVIVTTAAGASAAEIAKTVTESGGGMRRTLTSLGGVVVEVPNAALNGLANLPSVAHIALDRRVVSVDERTNISIGASAVREALGYDGSGVVVAVIDSGITPWHDDLTGGGLPQRVLRFVDFVNGRTEPYDDYGHGSHVAGIIGGNGADSNGSRAGVAPNVNLVVLKALDAHGNGRLSDVLAALDYVIANAAALNIRVINLSVAAGVYESYDSDLLTLAARRATEAGIVVVAAAGNVGRSSGGRLGYGGVTAPGNAPWVLTVGASSHMGTPDPSDDTIADFSSRGPTAIDRAAKPDLVAPGVGIESLSAPGSTMSETESAFLLDGTVPTTFPPYLSLSGTSMASPAVAGTVALMLQANPSLTPNAVKAILQYTARNSRSYDPLTEGAGFLNASGAVALAGYLASGGTTERPDSSGWSRRVIWGNRSVGRGEFTAGANAWRNDVVWGSATTPDGEHVELGVRCPDGQCTDEEWRPTRGRNVVWGNLCGGDDCIAPWSIGLFGANADDTVVWGTNDSGDTVVWGTSDGDTVVWGTSDDDTVVWGTSDDDTVVWGTSCGNVCTPVIWK